MLPFVRPVTFAAASCQPASMKPENCSSCHTPTDRAVCISIMSECSGVRSRLEGGESQGGQRAAPEPMTNNGGVIAQLIMDRASIEAAFTQELCSGSPPLCLAFDKLK